MVKDRKIVTILDVGCGEGFTLIKFKEFGIGKRLKGVDISENAISVGKMLYPCLNLSKGDVYDLRYKDNSFDLVVCSEVLEHLDNPRRALREVLRVTRKFCLLSVPNEPIFRLSNFLRGKNILRLGNDIEHVNHWSSIGFCNFVAKENVCVLDKKGPFPWTVILVKKN